MGLLVGGTEGDHNSNTWDLPVRGPAAHSAGTNGMGCTGRPSYAVALFAFFLGADLSEAGHVLGDEPPNCALSAQLPIQSNPSRPQTNGFRRLPSRTCIRRGISRNRKPDAHGKSLGQSNQPELG